MGCRSRGQILKFGIGRESAVFIVLDDYLLGLAQISISPILAVVHGTIDIGHFYPTPFRRLIGVECPMEGRFIY